jgi:hypothetical protein
MAYLPAQGAQTSGKLYLGWGQHFQEDPDLRVASHMWCDVTLTNPRGAWRIGSYSPYSVNGYLFEIPAAWADAHTPGLRLATGRFRDGGWGGQGPALFACGPWNHGNPPPDNAVLDAAPLLLYSSTATDVPPYHTMADYHHADEWAGGAWVTAGDRAAVVFVGTKGTGHCWYGLPDGTVWPEEPPYPPDPLGQRGWWSTGFVGRMLFYDPDDLAAVAAGARAPHEPQPYAALDLDADLWAVGSLQQKHHVADVAFDRARGLLYVLEPFADGEKPLVHVWAASSGALTARPDALIRAHGDAAWVGDGIYGSSGAGQSRRRPASAQRHALFQLRVRNDGPSAARFRVTGTSGDPQWSVRYGALGANLTPEVTGTGWTTPLLAPGATAMLALSVWPRSAVEAGARKAVRVRSESLDTPAVLDVVRAVAVADPLTGPAGVTALTAEPTARGAQVDLRLSGPGAVTVRVLNRAGRPVRMACRDRLCPGGATTLVWDGCDEAGLRVPAGGYVVEITVRGAEGAAARHLAVLWLRR